jgi:hypothetical protein
LVVDNFFTIGPPKYKCMHVYKDAIDSRCCKQKLTTWW